MCEQLTNACSTMFTLFCCVYAIGYGLLFPFKMNPKCNRKSYHEHLKYSTTTRRPRTPLHTAYYTTLSRLSSREPHPRFGPWGLADPVPNYPPLSADSLRRHWWYYYHFRFVTAYDHHYHHHLFAQNSIIDNSSQ